MYNYNLTEADAYALADGRHTAGQGAPLATNWKQRVLREPLTHFLVFGIAIFAVAHLIEARSKRYTIDVAPADITRLVNSYAQQYGSEPGPAQLHTLVDNYIREEIYLREGLALGLDTNDEIVRRRVAQKYDFLQQDMAVPREPTDAQLKAYYDAHRADFTRPQKRSFDQVYFAIDQRGEAAARQLAGDALARVQRGDTVSGDPFPGPQFISNLARDDVSRLFGGKDFAAKVFNTPKGQWAGPFRSGFGWHLVRVTSDQPAKPLSFTEAREAAKAAWTEADRRERNASSYKALVRRYSIERADLPS